jgi:hypothetical protein
MTDKKKREERTGLSDRELAYMPEALCSFPSTTKEKVCAGRGKSIS